ncbi:MAG: GTPase HflX [Bacilli bacterium]|nr:GTPase HflX [Bacilli bacterium]
MKALVINVIVSKKEYSPIKEMENLLATLDIDIEQILTQNVDVVHNSYYVGKGFLHQVGCYARENNIDVIVFNNDLSPLQIRNISDITSKDIMDRSMVIIKIFLERASSKEAKLQVEMASLKYYASRLIDKDHDYSQVTSGGAGGLQNKGSGEKEINIKKYLIRKTLKAKEDELKKIVQNRQNQRASRNPFLPVVAIVGYTNAGKSTLLNNFIRLTKNNKKDEILEENRLFATLDTTTRFIKVDHHYPFLLTDTVGFISSLPTTLIKAFRSTLEEIKDASLLIHVVDISSSNYLEEIKVTSKTLQEIGVGEKEVIYIYNKYDLVNENVKFRIMNDDELLVSLKDEECMEQILKLIDRKLEDFYVEIELYIPYTNMNVYYEILNKYSIIEEKEDANGITIIAQISKNRVKDYKEYFISSLY